MTADEWLSENGKKPYTNEGGGYPFYYWGTMDDFDPDDPCNESFDTDFLLPNDIYVKLKGQKTYPNVKAYETREQALEDFRQAFS